MSEVSSPAFAHREAVRTAVLVAAATPQTLAVLKKAAKAAVTSKKDGKPAEAVVAEMVAAGELHKHGTAKTAPYGRDKPVDPNDPEKVQEALLNAAATPQTRANLVKAAVTATKADKTFVEEQAARLIEAERLHKHGTTKTAPYGRDEPKPPHPLDTTAGKKAFDKLVAAAQKLLESTADLPAADLLDRLRRALTPEQAASVTPPTVTLLPKRGEVAPSTRPDAPDAATPTPSPERIRSALRSAYDELCLFPEFEDKLVEIRRLYHSAVRLLPGLTVPQFHRELEHLQAHRQVELHALNEVQSAKEPHLALARGDQLLYFAIWR